MEEEEVSALIIHLHGQPILEETSNNLHKIFKKNESLKAGMWQSTPQKESVFLSRWTEASELSTHCT